MKNKKVWIIVLMVAIIAGVSMAAGGEKETMTVTELDVAQAISDTTSVDSGTDEAVEVQSLAWNCYQLSGGDCFCDASGPGSLSCQVPATGTPDYRTWALGSTSGRCRAQVICSDGTDLRCNSRLSGISSCAAGDDYVSCDHPSGRTVFKNCP